MRGRFGRFATRLKSMKLETLFIIIFLIFGAILIYIIPPGWNSDETNHVYRIYQLSEGHLLSDQVVTPITGLKAFGGSVPTNLVKLFDQTGAQVPGTIGNPLYKIPTDLYKVHPDITKLKSNNKLTSINFSGSALYSPLAYILYIPVFWLGRLFSISLFWVIILSRIIGLIATGLAFFLAIRYSPIGKWIFFVVGLVPMIVVQAATVGADAPQVIVSVLFITFVLRKLLSTKEASLVDYGVLTLLGVSLLLVKIVYVPLLLLLIALPFIKPEYRKRKHIVLIFLTLLVSLIPGLLWMHAVSYININSNPRANFAAQKMFIFSHPLTYLRTLYYTFFTNTQNVLNNIFGNFVWDSTPLPAFYAYLAAAAAFLSLFVKSRREASLTALTKQGYRLWRLALVATGLITCLLIASALYIYSTTLHQSSIVGIQPRYFTPLLPIILLIFYGNTVRNQKVVKAGIVIMSCIALVGAVLAIYFRLYQMPALIA